MTPVRERRRDLIAGVALLITVIAALSSATLNPLFATIVITAAAATTLLLWRATQDVVLGMIGMVVGPFTEWAATSNGLWAYTIPSVAGLPLWVVPMWWIYPVTVARLIAAIVGKPPQPSSLVLVAALVLIEVPMLCAFGNSRPLLALSGTLIMLAIFLRRHHAPVDIVTLVICGVIGPLAELIPVQMGVWSYADSSSLPIWLPTGYGIFGAALVHGGILIGRPVHEWTSRINEAQMRSLRHLAFIAVSGVSTVCLLFRWPLISAGVIAVLVAHTARVWNSKRDYAVAVAGLICGVALELVATGSGLWWYSHSTFAGLPAWVPVMWPGFMMGLGRLGEASIGDGSPLAPPRVAVPLGVAIVVIELLLMSSMGNTSPLLLTGLLVAMAAVAFALAPSRRAIALLIGAAGLGLVCESLPVYLGIWIYPAFSDAGMPLWLAPGYALFALGTVHVGQGAAGMVHVPSTRRVPSEQHQAGCISAP